VDAHHGFAMRRNKLRHARAPLVIEQSALPSTFRGPRSASTAICFLLAGEEFPPLHRLAVMRSGTYAGTALLVHSMDLTGNHNVIKLGQNPEAGEQFQWVVPAGQWFGSCVQQPIKSRSSVARWRQALASQSSNRKACRLDRPIPATPSVDR
jgi:hypothetical protein